MTVFDLYESAIAFTRRNPSVGEVQLKLRTAENAVIDAAGGTQSKWLESHMRESRVFVVSDTDNTAKLPEGAGPILPGGVFDTDGEQWTVLKEEESSLAGQGTLYKRAITRNGNTLTFFGVPSKRKKTVTVVFISSFKPIMLFDGVFVEENQKAGVEAGKNLTSFFIRRPENMVFPDSYLTNGVIRIFSSDNIAKDYEITGNRTVNSMALLYTISIPIEVLSTSVSGFRTESGGGVAQYPAKIGRCMIPSRLRPAVLEYFKHQETKEQKYLQNMLTLVESFKRDI